jgi:RNA polymerase sigma-70 factor, ECF subfamily
VDQVEAFSEVRPLLFSIAYRMLSSVMEAEDIVQEAYLRWQRADLAEVESPKSYLSAVVTRLCIDHLRSARVQRETYYGPWLPEPLITAPNDNPASALARSETLSMAFLVLLESLSPEERAVFVLREVFDTPYPDIASTIGKNEATVRQMFSRARQRVHEGRPRFQVTQAEQEQVTMQFIQACMTGDLNLLMSTLAGESVVISDGGGKASAATRPIVGADHVARFVLGLLKKQTDDTRTELAVVNREPAFITYLSGQPFNVMVLEIRDGRVQAIRNVRNPDKLRHIQPLSA